MTGDGRDDAPDDEVVVPIEDALDLHPFRPRDIPSVVEAYLDAAVEAGFAEVRIVHGKGIGFQRDVVRRVLESDPRVLEFHNAPAERGSWGATVARLRVDRLD